MAGLTRVIRLTGSALPPVRLWRRFGSGAGCEARLCLAVRVRKINGALPLVRAMPYGFRPKAERRAKPKVSKRYTARHSHAAHPAAKPLRTALPKPLRADLAKPLRTALPKPLRTDLAKPLRTDLAKPLRTALPKPLRTALPKPLRADLAKLLRTDVLRTR